MNLLELFVKLSVDKGNLDKGLDDAEKKSTSFASKLGGGLKVAGAAIAGVATAAAGASAALVKGVSDTAAYGDNIDKMSQKLGLSTKAYQEWDYVLQISGSSIENMSMGLKTLTNKFDDAVNGSDSAVDTFKRLGLSMEDIQGMSREELFGEVITAFQGMEDSAARAALANDLFGRSGQELAPLFNTSAKETKNLIEQVNNLNGVMSEDAVSASAKFQDNLTALKTGFSGLKRGLTAEFLPGINSVLQGVTALMTGDSGAEGLLKDGFANIISSVEDLAPKITDIVSNLGGALAEVADDIIDAGLKLVTTLATGIADNSDKIIDAAFKVIDVLLDSLLDPKGISQLFDAALKLIMSLADGIIKNLPTLIPALVEVVLNIVNKLTDPESINMLLQAAIGIIVALTEGIIAALPELIEAAPEIIVNLILGITGALGQLLAYAPTIIMTIISGLASAFDKLVSNGGEIVDKIKSGVMDKIESARQWGKDLIDNFIGGLKAKWEDLKTSVSNIAGSVKDFLGFSEPEKGPLSDFHTYAPDMMELFAKGIRDNEDVVTKQLEDSFNFDDVLSPDMTVTHSVVGSSVGLAEVLADIAPVLSRIKAIEPGTLVGMIAPSMDEALGRRATAANRRLA